MKIYEGRRTPRGCIVRVNGDPLPPRNDLFNHSPDGFEWGYGGSGPAQLALAILCDHLGDDERAVRLHQHFKFAAIGGIKSGSWAMSTDDVDRVVRSIETKSNR